MLAGWRGANLELSNIKGWTPLFTAAYMNYTTNVSALIDAGASLGSVNNQGETPLHGAISQGNKQAARLLLDAGSDANATTNKGLTPLHLACSNDNLTLAAFLFECGARQVCPKKCTKCTYTLRRAADHISEGFLQYLPPDVRKKQQEKRAAAAAVEKRESEERALLESCQREWADESETKDAEKASNDVRISVTASFEHYLVLGHPGNS